MNAKKRRKEQRAMDPYVQARAKQFSQPPPPTTLQKIVYGIKKLFKIRDNDFTAR